MFLTPWTGSGDGKPKERVVGALGRSARATCTCFLIWLSWPTSALWKLRLMPPCLVCASFYFVPTSPARIHSPADGLISLCPIT